MTGHEGAPLARTNWAKQTTGAKIDRTANRVRLSTRQPSRHPNPTTKATALAYVIFERPDLDLAAKYLKDFGLKVVQQDANLLLLRGTGPAPYCYIVQKARKPRFVGLGLNVASVNDLKKLAALPTASAIEEVHLPGGGQRVRLVDPAGNRVDAICGQVLSEPLPRRAPIQLNAPDQIVRINSTQRPPQSPPDIIKLGHILLEVANYQAVSAWYTQHFGFIPSDICVLPDGSPAATFFRLDLGGRPADHHTLALAQSFMSQLDHCAFEVVDADAVGMGQRLLSDKGWQHSWGMGRHILGSQIFDYWRDPWHSKHEHYCDGDVFTSDVPAGIYPLTREAMSQWGPLMPKSFTKPELGIKNIAKLIANLYRTEDLSVKKLITLIRLFG